MAENVTPVTLNVKDFAAREVLLVDYKFNQATDREGQISGIPRGGRVNIRVKAMNDGNAELLGWMLAPTDPRDFSVKFQNTIDGTWSASMMRRSTLPGPIRCCCPATSSSVSGRMRAASGCVAETASSKRESCSSNESCMIVRP